MMGFAFPSYGFDVTRDDQIQASVYVHRKDPQKFVLENVDASEHLGPQMFPSLQGVVQGHAYELQQFSFGRMLVMLSDTRQDADQGHYWGILICDPDTQTWVKSKVGIDDIDISGGEIIAFVFPLGQTNPPTKHCQAYFQ